MTEMNCSLCLNGACTWRVVRAGKTTCEPPARLRVRAKAQGSPTVRLIGGPYDGQKCAIDGSRLNLYLPVICDPLVPGERVISPAKFGHYATSR